VRISAANPGVQGAECSGYSRPRTFPQRHSKRCLVTPSDLGAIPLPGGRPDQCCSGFPIPACRGCHSFGRCSGSRLYRNLVQRPAGVTGCTCFRTCWKIRLILLNPSAIRSPGPLTIRLVDEVFVLWHVHDLGHGDEDSKLIGIYSSQENAQAAKVRVGSQPGFVDTPEGFIIDRYRLNEDGWTEGYITVYPRTAR
jgi:hypothetical protein